MTKDPGPGFGILGRFLKWEAETPDAPFLRQPAGEMWREYTWAETGHAARQILATLRRNGCSRGDRIGIWSANCAQWIMADLALMMGGYVSVPLYASANAGSVLDILVDSECALLLVGKLDPAHWDMTRSAIPAGVRILSLPSFRLEGISPWEKPLDEEPGLRSIRSPSPDDLMTIIYTSGTTGKPKGVMHTYGTTMAAVRAASDSIFLDERGLRFISYLPLSHAAERGVVECGAIFSGGTISFVESVDRFAWTMREVRPTHFMSVPRVWQKFREGVLQKLSPGTLEFLLHLPVIAGWVRRYICRSLGLQDARVIISGAAPIHPELLRWFLRLGIVIREGYGLTEDFNVCSLNPPDDVRIGTTGSLFVEEEVRVLPDTQEIVQRAPWLMKGYFKRPELTAEVLKDGFFHTGDTGSLVDGYLTITGRVKDIFKTAKGEYIAPYPIEARFLAMPEIDHACVLGSRFSQPFIVVILSREGARLPPKEIEQRLADSMAACNAESMKYQKLRKVIVLRDEWTTENEMLTLTLKMKRNVVARIYEERLEPLYDREEKVSWAESILVPASV